MTPAQYVNFAGGVMIALGLVYFIAPKRWR